MLQLLKICFSLFFLFPALGEKSSEVVIVNTNTNQAESQSSSTATSPSQTVIAPTLNPSKAKKLRDARENAEVQTESLLLEKVEQERLKSEQSLLNKIFGSPQKPSGEGVVAPQASSSHIPAGVDRVYISGGLGVVDLNITTGNVNTYRNPLCFVPACFVSVGGSAQKYFLFDFSVFYSRHIVTERDPSNVALDSGIRRLVDQPAAAIAIKVAPWTGKIRPYGGLSVAYVGRRISTVNKAGESTITWETVDVGNRKWNTSIDGGVSGGLDVSLGHHVGLNIDFRHHWNLDSINTKKHNPHTYQILEHISKVRYLIFSVNLRYYF